MDLETSAKPAKEEAPDVPLQGLVEVPYERLSPEALLGLVEEFVTREGTDYGGVEYSLAAKRDHVLKQIRRGEVVILFDLASETCTLAVRDDGRNR